MALQLPGLTVVEHRIDVPLDHGNPTGPQVPLFARELIGAGGAELPMLVFLQGGPGGEGVRPGYAPLSPGWIERAMRDFRVLLLDQRGTGLSAHLGGLAAMSPADQATYLTHFRADSIVRDLELLREHLGIRRWSLLGQSFGGFCTFSYLSAAADSIAAAYITGGIPPIGAGPDAVYPRTYATMLERSRLFYERYPDDRARMSALLDRASAGTLLLPSGEPVTAGRLRSVGTVLGMSYGAETMHFLLERDPDSAGFRYGLADAMPFGDRALPYALLQEACYADGVATKWAADRLLPAEYDDPFTFFGEHVFSTTFADAADLAPYAAAAEILANHPWPRLYDENTLAHNEVPVAAAVYGRDAYVDRALSLETVKQVRGVDAWVTDDHEHDGLRTSGGTILDQLFRMVPPR